MTDMTPEQMVQSYVRLRDHKQAADKEFKKSMERVNAGMDKLEALMLKHLQDTGGTSLACKGVGTVYLKAHESATVKDREAFLKFVVEQNLWDALDARANKPFVKEFMKEQGDDVPGVKFTAVQTVGVRRG